jgi:hypothetical protein
MLTAVVQKEPDYVLNHCAKYLARTNIDERHSFFGLDVGQPRALISEPWRFPIMDADDMRSGRGSTRCSVFLRADRSFRPFRAFS